MYKLFREPLSYFIAYLLAMTITFGHAYTRFPEGYVGTWTNTIISYGVFEKTIGSMFAAAGWPLYWSVQGWKK